MNAVITDIAQVTPNWLTETLKQAGALERGCVQSVTSHSPRSSVVPLEIVYSSDAAGEKPSRLIFKFIRASEVRFYHDLAPEIAHLTGILRCYGAAFNFNGNQSQELFEDISPTHFDAPEMLPLTLPYAQQITDTLADIHAHWWSRPHLKPNLTALAEDVPGRAFADARDRFAHFCDFLGDRLSPQRRAIYERVLAALPLPAWSERVSSGRHVTLVHGDTHWWNFMYPRDAARHSLYLLDWAEWHIDVGVSDLAYTIALECYPEHRARIEQPLVRRYHQRLQSHGIEAYDWEQCWLDYRMALIVHLIWPVVWHNNLSPNIWWPALECTMLAFEDLNCMDLL